MTFFFSSFECVCDLVAILGVLLVSLVVFIRYHIFGKFNFVSRMSFEQCFGISFIKNMTTIVCSFFHPIRRRGLIILDFSFSC